MSALFRAFASSVTRSTLSVTVNVPSGTVQNDVMVACISGQDATRPTGLGTPSGWTLLDSVTPGTTALSATFIRVAGASEPASYTWTFTGTLTNVVGVIGSYSGCRATQPDAHSGQSNGSSTSVTAPTCSPTQSGILVFFGSSGSTGASFTPASGFTERADVAAASTLEIELADATYSAGATGAVVAVCSGGAPNAGFLIALSASLSGYQLFFGSL